MVKTFAEALMCAEADAICGAGYGSAATSGSTAATATGRGSGTPGPARSSWRSRSCGTGSYFPDWLLDHRRRAEQALVSVVATSYLLGVSTRRVEKLVEQLGVEPACPRRRSQQMAQHLDAQVEAFRNRPLDAGPYTFVWLDALTLKVREGGRIVNVARPDRGRGQRRRPPRGPRLWTSLRARGRRRLAGVPAQPDRPRPVRGPAGRSPTPTAVWSTRSAPPCPARPGSAAAPTTCATC